MFSCHALAKGREGEKAAVRRGGNDTKAIAMPDVKHAITPGSLPRP
jgi:hypothetical protein